MCMLYSDEHMPCVNGGHPQEFASDAEMATAYRDIYRYCPSYAELLL